MVFLLNATIRILGFLSFLLGVTTASLVTQPGDVAAIPSWNFQSTSKVGNDASKLSSSNLDTSSWYHIGPRGTLMAGLLENKAYTDTELFFSNNLEHFDKSQFTVPWFYRSTFSLNLSNSSNSNSYSNSSDRTHYLLQTHGISSRADIYLNGELVADKDIQAGAYAGQVYDITPHVKQENVLLVRVYPTDYNRDFALGFVDWNPYPPDNGTGIWRPIELHMTGPVSLSAPSMVWKNPEGKDWADISVKVDVRNFGERDAQGRVVCTVLDPKGRNIVSKAKGFAVKRKGKETVEFRMEIFEPKIWWPKQWGQQPLYKTHCRATTGSTPNNAPISDEAERMFGIRFVTSSLNSHNDTTFFVNGKPFQVLGAGYTSDIFLRFDEEKLKAQFQYVLDMGLNTVRLEGKQEHPYLYSLADEMGLMVMAGWECCDKWEGWSFNDEGSGLKWSDSDYAIANHSMRHEVEMMQSHPSMLAFLIGSDFWPDDRATRIYVDALKEFDWDTPIIASASQRGYPALLGNGGMKMDGPYDWVPPNYWYGDKLGAAFGFGSELGAGVGTLEISSLKKFLFQADMEDLWLKPNKGLYHMSTNVSSFYTREIYNSALFARYGKPSSLQDYLMKAQMMDYEATRAEFEGYGSRWNAERPATGLIYWMLNNAWPSLHWNLFDYYLKPAGSFYGTKTGSRIEHILYDYSQKSIYVVNRGLGASRKRNVEVELLGLDGKTIATKRVDVQTEPNTSKKVTEVLGMDKIKDVALLRLVLRSEKQALSRNVYWLSSKPDTLDWDNSTWYHTPTTSYADFTALNNLTLANVSISATSDRVTLENKSGIPAVFIRLSLVNGDGNDVLPVFWEDNYVTLWPGEKMDIGLKYDEKYGGVKVKVDGKNVGEKVVEVTGY
ncbi:glycoside hydrolase family 2 protein [Zopfia rhizophila CBS 207.26]|uniref:Glycoside hydrolase family 2 protein n=1 Tax=Zopfia rhizophila CBS 207.26 TaxID=1314779 RepID=A0A6A6DJW6_9PEZI|nr:glycoside hydrolase family 2 protein [Zopfia rhizophila CBS 207.26]